MKNKLMKKNMKNWFLFFALFSGLMGVGFLGCGDKKDAQDEQTFFQGAGQKVDQGIQKTDDKIDAALKKAGEKTQEALERAGEKVKDATQ